MDKHNVLRSLQPGFRANCSTGTALVEVMNDLLLQRLAASTLARGIHFLGCPSACLYVHGSKVKVIMPKWHLMIVNKMSHNICYEPAQIC